MSLQEKYKPRFLADISGQENVKKGIRRFVLSPGFQVLFFLGPTGVGKTSLANIIAKLCMCENFSEKTPDACGVCESCIDVEKHEQYYLTKHYCNGRTIEELESDIEDWRYSKAYRVGVLFVDEVGYLGSKGVAILQKAVDEIRENGMISRRRLILILATTPNFYRKIDSAFKGRSRLVRFGKLTSQDIARRLQFIANTEGFKYAPEAIDALSADVELGMRHAIGLLDQVAETGKKIDNKLIYQVLRLPPEELFLSILARLNTNPKSMFLRANKWIDFVGLESFRQNLYRAYYTLRLMHAKLPIRRILSLPLSNRYEEVVTNFHDEELRIVSDMFNSRRFLESDNSDRVLEMLLNLSYRLVKLEFELESVEDLQDKIERRIRDGRRRSKRK